MKQFYIKTFKLLAVLFTSQLLFLLPNYLQAQTYPVQANLNIASPCPSQLSGLFPMGGSKVNLSVLLTDIAQPEVQVRFSIKIEGNGLTLQTPPTLLLQPISIMGGVPRMVGVELEQYFRKENLIASGNGASQFMQSGSLPEGFYTFTIHVVEHLRNVQISNKAKAFAWIIQNDPPLITSPQNNQQIEVWGTQFIYISWIPQHVPSPGSGSNIYYKLSLWELPTNANPNIVVNTLQPLESVETISTSVIWGPDRAILIPGKFYVVAVKAIDPRNEVNFKNNGLSVPHIFKYGTTCSKPINTNHSNITVQTADLIWHAMGNTSKYRVEFKPVNDQSGVWRSMDAPGQTATLKNLAPATKYAYRVSAVCGSFTSEPTNPKEFTTQSIPPMENECTPTINVPNPGNQPLLETLAPNLLIMAAGFPVVVNSFNKVGPFTFDGIGFITLPLFDFNLRANLKGIKVNTAYHLVGGIVEAMQGDSVTMINMDNDAATGPGAVDFSNPNDTVYISSPIDSVYMNPDSTWTVITSDGETVVITPGEGGTMVVDPDGNGVVIVDGQVYTVTTGGGNQDGTGTGTEVTPTAICQQIVSFKPGGSLHKYGFDAYKDKMPPGTYHAVNVDDKTIHLPWKSFATGGSDRLYAETSSSSAPTFTYQSGQPVTASSSESGYQLWTGTPPTGEDNLLAMCNETSVAGGVRVKSYDLVRHKVAVVPVGNSQPSFTAAQLQNALNQIYAQAVIEWQVTLEQPISAANIPTLNDGLEVAETDYSPEMRSIKWAYLAQRTPAPNTVYLFVISGFTGKDDWVGYMPLNTSYGFLTPTASVRDAAHELGHGVFNLRHTFSNDNIVTLPQSSTQNLMDYPSTSSGQVPSTELFKYQWDNIHDPEGGWFVFEDSEEGAMSWTFIDSKHTRLFNHIYSKNNKNNLQFLNIINELLQTNSSQEIIDIDYTGSNDKEWINSWKIRVMNSDNIFKDVIENIQNAEKGEKIKKIVLRPKHVYIGKFLFEDTEYPIAIYGNGETTTMENAFTKVVVSELNELKKNGNDKHILCDETYTKYIIVALYEENKGEPSVIIQVEKFVFQNTLETWLRYLRLLKSHEHECGSNFCCVKCGKDLTITLEKLRIIFPNSNLVDNNGAEFAQLFNEALKAGGFNSCERQAKLFAQIGHESAGFNATEEGKLSNGSYASWSINHLLNYFKLTSGAKRHWFNQDFWDKKKFKDFITVNYYEKVDSNATHKSEGTKDYFGVYNGENQSHYHVKIPIDFKEDEDGEFIKYIVPSTDKELIRKNIFIYAYGGVLGNKDPSIVEDTEDGWLYRGRGAIQLTGKNNYQKNQNTINYWFKLNFDLVNNPNLVATDRTVIVYSAIAYILQNLSKIEDMDKMTIDQFSSLINTGNSNNSISNVNGADDRRNRYNLLINNEKLFKCDE